MFERIKQIIAIWRESVQHSKQNPVMIRTRDELEFLPAAIEIQETPAPKAARVLALLLIAIIPVALLWSYFSFVDKETSSQGKLVPAGKVKIIQPVEIGKVQEILVQDGEEVKAGQLLLTLEPAAPLADVEQIRNELVKSKLVIRRIKTLFQAIEDRKELVLSIYPEDTLIADSDFQIQLQQQEHMLQEDYQVFFSGEKEYLDKIREKQSAIDVIEADLHRVQLLIPLHVDIESAVSGLYHKGHAAKLEWLRAREQYIHTVEQLSIDRQKLHEARAAKAVVESGFQRFKAEFFRHHREELIKENQQAYNLDWELNRALAREQNYYLRSPINGIVQELQVNTIGGVVEPARALMKIVPENMPLEVEVMLENKDIGSIKADQPAEVKIDTYSYTTFGHVNGTVLTLPGDSTTNMEGLDYYPVRVALNEQHIVAPDGSIKMLRPGMNVTVDIKVGERRLLNYFLSPLKRYKDESLNEP